MNCRCGHPRITHRSIYGGREDQDYLECRATTITPKYSCPCDCKFYRADTTSTIEKPECNHIIGEERGLGLISQSFFDDSGDEHIFLNRSMQKFTYCPNCGEKL